MGAIEAALIGSLVAWWFGAIALLFRREPLSDIALTLMAVATSNGGALAGLVWHYGGAALYG